MFGRLRCTCLAEHSCEEVGEGAMREVKPLPQVPALGRSHLRYERVLKLNGPVRDSGLNFSQAIGEVVHPETGARQDRHLGLLLQDNCKS